MARRRVGLEGLVKTLISAQTGIVVIGRNEGERLGRCLESVGGQGRVVYVDSGSSDGSIARARGLGAEVVELDLSKPFTAARARNAGFARLRELEPEVEFVQFVDGDCEIRESWIDTAATALRQDPTTTVVCGRLRERFPEKSIYNRMCDIGWDYPIGEIEACGGLAMYRASACVAASGFDDALIAGEEFELCSRLRKAGGRVRRIDAEMAWHDVGITRFLQWWKRAVRSGFGSAEGWVLYDASTGAVHRRRVLRAVVWAAAVPVCILTSLTVGFWESSAWLASALLILLWCFNFVRLLLREKRSRHDLALAFWLAAFSTLGKFAELRGVAQYVFTRSQGRATPIIEYRGA